MSDSLVLKGLKDVRNHTGSEMLLQRPPRGGDAYPVKKWWATNASQTIYVGCSVFKVTQGSDSVFLAIDTAEMSTVRVDSDANFAFKFFINKEISRAALFTDAWELIEHYVFPKISGGKVMTVTPDGAASRPSPGPATGPVASVTLVGSTSTAGDGAEGPTNTTGGNGNGLTVSYDVASLVASNLSIGTAGSGYQVGDAFTVDGDTGVTGTVASIS